MTTFWHYFLASAKQAWLEYWLPIRWLFSTRQTTVRELVRKEKLSTQSISIWWIIGTTLTSAMLASGAFYLVALYIQSEGDGVSARSEVTMSLSVVWTISALRIGFFLHLRKD
ncbi:hypothetical protein H8K35_08250 [Undibacterium sp. LX40W]|uniref:Uncharacterized protein n=1 Tax=Undibacterium nitidum TaxID=2762298 RepID=A0A923HKZ4_9BURK|nr:MULTISPECIES: hypothetical protein [Undibacterium]MBC3881575.1 hypothetical protein [Undibacterium nitidum]MBC3891643.1 hypothetical protein [Undibacterium sp. LX40W]